MIPLCLVSGGSYTEREAEIASRIANQANLTSCAVILEGLPHGELTLMDTDAQKIYRLAPACMCCIGSISLRVTLNRIIRNSPQAIFLALATVSHLDNILKLLQNEPYDRLLTITELPWLPSNNI